MAYALRNRELFTAEVEGETYTFTCYTQSTSYGFRHICTEGYNNTTECRYVRNDIVAKATYYNRTWESFRYETVLCSAIKNVAPTKEVAEKLHAILIEKRNIEEHEQCEKELQAFSNLWNGLTEENKQHIRNGVGENGITSQEQADTVMGVMKMMTLFQSL